MGGHPEIVGNFYRVRRSSYDFPTQWRKNFVLDAIKLFLYALKHYSVTLPLIGKVWYGYNLEIGTNANIIYPEQSLFIYDVSAQSLYQNYEIFKRLHI